MFKKLCFWVWMKKYKCKRNSVFNQILKAMKKSLIILSVLFLSGCGCVLSQIPPQTIYADSNCEGVLPDYRGSVVASDNCEEQITILQTPAAGTLLTVNNPAVTVVLTARDAFGNVSKPLSVSVTLIDTIPPILNWPVGQLNMSDQDAVNLYNNWVAAVKVHGIAKWMYDRTWQHGIPMLDTTVVDSCGNPRRTYPELTLKYFTNTIELTDEEYAQYLDLVLSNQ